jgi:hypothetical protein
MIRRPAIEQSSRHGQLLVWCVELLLGDGSDLFSARPRIKEVQSTFSELVAPRPASAQAIRGKLFMLLGGDTLTSFYRRLVTQSCDLTDLTRSDIRRITHVFFGAGTTNDTVFFTEKTNLPRRERGTRSRNSLTSNPNTC